MLLIKHPVIIVDLSNAAPDLKRIVMTRANQIIAVSTPSLPSLRLARSLINEIKDVRGGEDQDIDLIVNMRGLDAANEVPKVDIEKAMELEISSTIAFSGKLFMKLENEGKKLIDVPEGMEIVKTALLPILKKSMAVDLDGQDQDTGKPSGFFQTVLRKIKSK